MPEPLAPGARTRAPTGGAALARATIGSQDEASHLEPLTMPERVLVTGALGCLGAWVARCVLDDGDVVVGYDLGDERSRLELVLGDDADRVELVKGDITELAALERALDEHAITRVVHLAALQVPFVRANPPLGMHVNVAGTVNVFDAVSRRLDRIPCVSCTRARQPCTTRPIPRPLPRPEGRGPRRSTGCRSSPTRASRASTVPRRACRRSAFAPTSCTVPAATRA